MLLEGFSRQGEISRRIDFPVRMGSVEQLSRHEALFSRPGCIEVGSTEELFV